MDENMTVAEAKSLTQRVELEITDTIPELYVDRVEQQKEGVLMTCSSDGDVQWAGGATVYLKNSPNFEEILAAIEAKFSESENYSTGRHLDGSREVLDVIGNNQSTWTIGPSANQTTLALSCWSPCFPLQEDMSPSDRY
ncbi:hypothetical protein [Microbacterium halimionae]|uniref:hypothetical protein n=1 Tax=Microbacterium halimionae TaxID=1526413 RepID=UPI0015F8787E|nr:hypothetical protein [Microbacterium halimionae]